MIAHVNVFNERSTLVLDFNIALTGFDVQSMRLSDVLSGMLPSTPIGTNHIGPDTSIDPEDDVCQRNDRRSVYPDADGFIRVDPVLPATPDDNTLATAAYPVPAFAPNGPFAQQVYDSLDSTPDSLGCDDGTVDGVLEGPIRGLHHGRPRELLQPVQPDATPRTTPTTPSAMRTTSGARSSS